MNEGVVVLTRCFSQDEFNRFAALSGDDNPIHVDPAFAARTRFGHTVAHGMLLYAALCGALSSAYPEAEQLEQELMFPTPTYAGEKVTITLEPDEALPDGRLWLNTTICKEDGSLGLQGRMLIHPGKRRAGVGGAA